jgi:hypothetical protein
VHETPFTRTSAQRSYAILQAKFGGDARTSYWANSHWMWDVPGWIQNLDHMSGCGGEGSLGNGCSESSEMYGLPVGASEEGEFHLVMDESVSKHIHSFYLFLIWIIFGTK